ncbi:alpha/beta fold hydrolase [Arthrobacter cupressi]|uniref:Non-heme chloroperoxidase n=1 Tax=Arthrobacter cupressi TaxID=1045773 RepID=A0A1G8LDS2_9MICC|nr:alpha/beta hydrolase [Arthrobacter cupressi]NYD77660.1 non-heme chloroperoxidase [Arthrobacter cupressi]SDI53637.1 non-heme chloroperoxidase [Arthrobacter cupressi]
MPFITTTDGTRIYYTEQGPAMGRPVILSHGWPLSSDAWQVELKLLADHGYRAIAHDRRGHGRSSQPWTGNDMDTYARDLAELVEQLGLQDLVVIGHSTGGGEVVRYAAQHGAGRVAKVITVGAVPPVMVQSESNPEGTPIEAFDGIRESVLKDRSQFYQDLTVPFFGANREGSAVSQGARDDFWRQGMLTGLHAAYECVAAFSETDFTNDLQALDVPIMIAHGDDDQIVPIKAAALKSAELVRHGELKVYEGAPHGIYGDFQKQLGEDILDFIKK